MAKKLSKKQKAWRRLKNCSGEIIKRFYKTSYQVTLATLLSASPQILQYIQEDTLKLSRINPLLIPVLTALISAIDNSIRASVEKFKL